MLYPEQYLITACNKLFVRNENLYRPDGSGPNLRKI